MQRQLRRRRRARRYDCADECGRGGDARRDSGHHAFAVTIAGGHRRGEAARRAQPHGGGHPDRDGDSHSAAHGHCRTHRRADAISGLRVTSDDGNAELDVPAGALPPGVSPGDLSVRDVSNDPEAFSAKGVETLAVYRLQPASLVLAAPVTLKVQLQLPDSGMLMVYHFSDTLEAPEDIVVEFDEAGTGLASVSVALSHFSIVVFSVDDVFALELTPLGRHVAGELFTVRATITRDHPQYVVWREAQFQDQVVIERLASQTFESWGMYGTFFGQVGVIGPGVKKGRPPVTRIPSPGPDEFTVDQQFWCGAESDVATVTYHAVLFWSESVFRTTGNTIVEDTASRRAGFIRRETSGRCTLLILELRNVYSRLNPDDRNTYTVRVLYKTATGELREFDVESAGGTVLWEVVQAPCGTTSEPQEGDRELWYSHGVGSLGGQGPLGSCTVPQEDMFEANFSVTFRLPDSNIRYYGFDQDTARAKSRYCVPSS